LAAFFSKPFHVMTINSSLTKAQYISASLVIRYRRITTIIYSLLGIFFAGFAIYSKIEFPEMDTTSEFIIAFIFLILPVITTYFSAVMNFNSNPRLTEPVQYIFSDDNLCIKGESFMTQFTWEKVYKVTQTKNWVFVWQNRLVANPISKQDISPDQILELRAILAMHGVKNNL
jgi:hypothetical protein